MDQRTDDSLGGIPDDLCAHDSSETKLFYGDDSFFYVRSGMADSGSWLVSVQKQREEADHGIRKAGAQNDGIVGDIFCVVIAAAGSGGRYGL